LNYWKTNSTVQSAVITNLGNKFFQITFVRRPAELGVTYHVQSSSNLLTWTDIATYAGTNTSLTASAAEISRSGAPNEKVTIRDTSGMNGKAGKFLRINVTRP
jgi:hypothetical protein